MDHNELKKIEALSVQINLIDARDPEADVNYTYYENDDNDEATHWQSVLNYACELGDLDRVIYMVENGADVNQQEPFTGTACEVAVRLNRYKIVNFLIYNGLDINYDSYWNSSYIKTAVYYKNVEMVKLLLDNGALINRNFILCSDNGGSSLEMLKLLVSRGADLKSDYHGHSILQETMFNACKYSDIFTVKYLISIGADIHKKNIYGDSCLLSACKCGNLEIIIFLIENGMDTEYINKNSTVMDVTSKNKNVIEYFLNKYLFCNKNGFYNIPCVISTFI
jgi:ankyrin repeat protein